VDWAIDPKTRPADLAELKSQTGGMLIIPARITRIEFVQPDLATLLLRLPNAQMAQESVDLVQAGNLDYKLPLFYFDKLGEGGAGISNIDLLYSRIADYTISQCR
jgi:hypothetical protein